MMEADRSDALLLPNTIFDISVDHKNFNSGDYIFFADVCVAELSNKNAAIQLQAYYLTQSISHCYMCCISLIKQPDMFI